MIQCDFQLGITDSSTHWHICDMEIYEAPNVQSINAHSSLDIHFIKVVTIYTIT